MLALIPFFFLAAACNKSSSSPTAPTAPTTPPVVVTAPTVSQMPVVAGATISGLDHIVELVWDPVPQATVYVIEDRRDGQVFQTEIAETRVDVSEPGVHCIGIRSKNSAGMSGTPPCRSLMIVDMRDVIEALFFSAGPYRETEHRIAAGRTHELFGDP